MGAWICSKDNENFRRVNPYWLRRIIRKAQAARMTNAKLSLKRESIEFEVEIILTTEQDKETLRPIMDYLDKWSKAQRLKEAEIARLKKYNRKPTTRTDSFTSTTLPARRSSSVGPVKSPARVQQLQHRKSDSDFTRPWRSARKSVSLLNRTPSMSSR